MLGHTRIYLVRKGHGEIYIYRLHRPACLGENSLLYVLCHATVKSVPGIVWVRSYLSDQDVSTHHAFDRRAMQYDSSIPSPPVGSTKGSFLSLYFSKHVVLI